LINSFPNLLLIKMEADKSSVDDKNVKIETEGTQSIEDLTNSNTEEANVQENDKQQQNDAGMNKIRHK